MNIKQLNVFIYCVMNYQFCQNTCRHIVTTVPTFSMFISFFSPQDDSIQSAVTPCCPQTSIPLLMACTANVKTVVANPMVYLTNLTHDILQTINALHSPPHPDVVNNEVRQSHLCISSSSMVDCIIDHFSW